MQLPSWRHRSGSVFIPASLSRMVSNYDLNEQQDKVITDDGLFFLLKLLAFMTKLIQAAPSESLDRSWIVPEGIIPIGASTITKGPRQSGVGKWIFSDSKIINAMVKEGSPHFSISWLLLQIIFFGELTGGVNLFVGKYKMINTTAFIRPDLPQLIYAQMTYRVATGFQNLKRQASHSMVQLHLSDNRPFDCNATLRYRLQCVLYFPRIDQSKVPESSSLADTKPDTLNEQLPQLPSVLVARAAAVDEIKLSITTRDLDKELITVPRYNMAILFANYSQGLATIRQECQRANVELDDLQDHWIGLYESKSTIPLAIDLWKLCQMLPSSKSRTK